jgi:hypothetical protein
MYIDLERERERGREGEKGKSTDRRTERRKIHFHAANRNILRYFYLELLYFLLKYTVLTRTFQAIYFRRHYYLIILIYVFNDQLYMS